MNRDFVEMLTALSAEGVEFLIVGAYAVAGHGLPRATGDIDLWVRPSPDNASKVWNALGRFGAPRSRLTPESFIFHDFPASSARQQAGDRETAGSRRRRPPRGRGVAAHLADSQREHFPDGTVVCTVVSSGRNEGRSVVAS